MSLVPMFSSWWEDLDRPHRLLDQHFGVPLITDDLLPSSAFLPYDTDILVLRPRCRTAHRCHPYNKSLYKKSSGVSTVRADKNTFEVTLDVQQFAPEEINVKVVGNDVVVEGKHEEKQDEHGWVSRQFVRKYTIPEQCNVDELKTTLSSDGVLTITAPRKEIEQKKNERIIKIQNTGQPAIRNNTSNVVNGEKGQSPQMQKKSTATERS